MNSKRAAQFLFSFFPSLFCERNTKKNVIENFPRIRFCADLIVGRSRTNDHGHDKRVGAHSLGDTAPLTTVGASNERAARYTSGHATRCALGTRGNVAFSATVEKTSNFASSQSTAVERVARPLKKRVQSE